MTDYLSLKVKVLVKEIELIIKDKGLEYLKNRLCKENITSLFGFDEISHITSFNKNPYIFIGKLYISKTNIDNIKYLELGGNEWDSEEVSVSLKNNKVIEQIKVNGHIRLLHAHNKNIRIADIRISIDHPNIYDFLATWVNLTKLTLFNKTSLDLNLLKSLTNLVELDLLLQGTYSDPQILSYLSNNHKLRILKIKYLESLDLNLNKLSQLDYSNSKAIIDYNLRLNNIRILVLEVMTVNLELLNNLQLLEELTVKADFVKGKLKLFLLYKLELIIYQNNYDCLSKGKYHNYGQFNISLFSFPKLEYLDILVDTVSDYRGSNINNTQQSFSHNLKTFIFDYKNYINGVALLPKEPIFVPQSVTSLTLPAYLPFSTLTGVIINLPNLERLNLKKSFNSYPDILNYVLIKNIYIYLSVKLINQNGIVKVTEQDFLSLERTDISQISDQFIKAFPYRIHEQYLSYKELEDKYKEYHINSLDIEVYISQIAKKLFIYGEFDVRYILNNFPNLEYIQAQKLSIYNLTSSITELNIREFSDTYTDFRKLNSLKKLRIDNIEISSYTVFQFPKTLTHLNISFNGYLTFQFITELSSLINLEYLKLSCSGMYRDIYDTKLYDLTNLSKLIVFNLTSHEIDLRFLKLPKTERTILSVTKIKNINSLSQTSSLIIYNNNQIDIDQLNLYLNRTNLVEFGYVNNIEIVYPDIHCQHIPLVYFDVWKPLAFYLSQFKIHKNIGLLIDSEYYYFNAMKLLYFLKISKEIDIVYMNDGEVTNCDNRCKDNINNIGLHHDDLEMTYIESEQYKKLVNEKEERREKSTPTDYLYKYAY